MPKEFDISDRTFNLPEERRLFGIFRWPRKSRLIQGGLKGTSHHIQDQNELNDPESLAKLAGTLEGDLRWKYAPIQGTMPRSIDPQSREYKNQVKPIRKQLDEIYSRTKKLQNDLEQDVLNTILAGGEGAVEKLGELDEKAKKLNGKAVQDLVFEAKDPTKINNSGLRGIIKKAQTYYSTPEQQNEFRERAIKREAMQWRKTDLKVQTDMGLMSTRTSNKAIKKLEKEVEKVDEKYDAELTKTHNEIGQLIKSAQNRSLTDTEKQQLTACTTKMEKMSQNTAKPYHAEMINRNNELVAGLNSSEEITDSAQRKAALKQLQKQHSEYGKLNKKDKKLDRKIIEHNKKVEDFNKLNAKMQTKRNPSLADVFKRNRMSRQLVDSNKKIEKMKLELYPQHQGQQQPREVGQYALPQDWRPTSQDIPLPSSQQPQVQPQQPVQLSEAERKIIDERLTEWRDEISGHIKVFNDGNFGNIPTFSQKMANYAEALRGLATQDRQHYLPKYREFMADMTEQVMNKKGLDAVSEEEGVKKAFSEARSKLRALQPERQEMARRLQQGLPKDSTRDQHKPRPRSNSVADQPKAGLRNRSGSQSMGGRGMV